MNAQMAVLNHKLELFIPDRDSKGDLIDNDTVVSPLAKSMAQNFGSVRKRTEQSLWLNGTDRVEEETTILCSSFPSTQVIKAISLIANASQILSTTLKQAEIAIELDGRLLIATANYEINSRLEIGQELIMSKSHSNEKQDESRLIKKCLQILKEGKESPKTLSRIARALEETQVVNEW
ncbi:MAG: hypothetical protein R3F48_13575 [Candidatus Zixiibacteriota bacterium]